jgi:hypothetical protein
MMMMKWEMKAALSVEAEFQYTFGPRATQMSGSTGDLCSAD